MSGRNLFLVAYDVRNARRLRQIHKKLKGFGQPLQFSVFQCELTHTEKLIMIGAVTEIIHHREDRVLIVNMGRRKGRADRVIEVLGRQELPPEKGPLVI
jgi:CRISPR-associated protein Cas2